MDTLTSILIPENQMQEIKKFVALGYFKDIKELIYAAIQKFLYELSLNEMRQRVPQRDFSEEQLEDELEKIARIKHEIWQEQGTGYV